LKTLCVWEAGVTSAFPDSLTSSQIINAPYVFDAMGTAQNSYNAVVTLVTLGT